MKTFFIFWASLLFVHLVTGQDNFSIQPNDTIYSNTLQVIQANRNPVRVLELLNAIADLEACSNDSLRADLYYFYGSAYGQLGKFDTSQLYLEKALVISSNANLPVNQVGTLIAQGNVYWGMNFFHLALEKYQQALVITEVQKSEEFDTFLVMILGNIGGIYAQLGEIDKAFEHVKMSNEVGNRTNNLRPRSHLKIGRYLITLNRPEAALDSLRQTMRYIGKHNDSVAMVHCYQYMGKAFMEMGRYDSSAYYLNLSSQTGKMIGYPLIDQDILSGELSMRQLKFQEAYKHFILALQMAKEKNHLDNQAEIYEHLSLWSKKQGKSRLALEYFQSFKQLTDSINSKERSVRVHELQTKFDVKRKEEQIGRLLLEQELSASQLSQARWQNTMIISAAFFIILLAILFFYFNKRKQKADQMAQALQYEALQKRYSELLHGPTSVEINHELSELNMILHNPLTEREYETLQLSMKGLTNQQVADQIFVSLSTVKFHLGNVYNKFGVSNKKEALEYVVKSS